MLTKQDIEGKTLAELRTIYAQLDTEQAIENEALRTEYLALQAKFRDRKETDDLEVETKNDEIRNRYYADVDNINMEYRSYGVKIGELMDTRANTTEEAALFTIRKTIEGYIAKREELLKQRRDRNATFRKEVLEYKKANFDKRHKRAMELQNAERDLRKRRFQLSQQIKELRDAVVDAIKQHEEEGRAETE